MNREMHILEVFSFLRNHYWDSLEAQRNLLEAHFDSCQAMLISQGQPEVFPDDGTAIRIMAYGYDPQHQAEASSSPAEEG